MKIPWLNCPGNTFNVVPDTFAEIWSIPRSSSEREGQETWYADTGGWCETCSVRNTTLAGAPFRLRLDIWSATSAWAGCGVVGAVEGLFPGLERVLRPLRVLFELLPLFMLDVSETLVLASKDIATLWLYDWVSGESMSQC